MMKLILSALILFVSVLSYSEAPMSSKKVKASEKCPQMLKGYEAAKKLAIPDEQKAMMADSLKKNGCLK